LRLAELPDKSIKINPRCQLHNEKNTEKGMLMEKRLKIIVKKKTNIE